jgi:hypothetical protein
MGEQRESGGFWSSIPGVLTAVGGIITAVTGLLIALGSFGGGDGGTERQEERSQTPSLQVDNVGAATADPIAGTWVGEASQGDRGVFDVRLEIGVGCALNERCGTISVSSLPCFGDLYLHTISGEGYEFNVDNFSPASDEACAPGAGEFLTPQDEGTLLYTTSYDDDIQGVLHKQSG